MLHSFRPNIITILAITFVLTLGLLALIPGPERAGAEIVIDPPHLLNQAGATWTAKVYVRTNQPVNSVDTTIHFDPQLVELQQADIDQSDFDMTVFKPQINQDQGTVRFVQTTLSAPQKDQSLVGQLDFKGIKQGHMELNHSQTTIVAHDGQGTNLYQPQLRQSLLLWLVRHIPGVES